MSRGRAVTAVSPTQMCGSLLLSPKTVVTHTLLGFDSSLTLPRRMSMLSS